MSTAVKQRALSALRRASDRLPNDPRAWWSHSRGQIAADATVGVVAGLILIIVTLSDAALIFSGRLAPYVSRGIALALIGSFILCLVVALGSGHPLGLACSQDTCAVVLVGSGVSLVGLLAARSPQRLLPTLLVTIALASLSAGVCFYAIGALRVGRLIRYVPYPVIGGFLAGTGWQLAMGAFVVTAGAIGPRGVLDWLAAGAVRIVPCVLVAAALFVLMRRIGHYLVMPATLVAAVALFYVALWLTRTSVDGAASAGWLLGPFPGGALLQPPNAGMVAQVDWGAVAAQAGNLAALVVISAIALLLNVTSLEVALHHDMDLDHELRVAGVGNVLAGLVGGLSGYQVLSVSLLARRAGGRSRLVGLVAAATVALTLIVGTALLAAVPRFVVGGLLLLVGLDLLIEWGLAAWRRVSHAEYAIVVLIAVVIGWAGFLQGLVVGVVAASVLFAIQYSRISAVKHVLSGAVYHSNVDRPPNERQVLERDGEQIAIFELQGFLFFGSAAGMVEDLRRRLEDPDPQRLPVRYLILDFRRVTGIDSSAALSFSKLLHLLRARHVTLVLTHLAPRLEHLLRLDADTGDGDEHGTEGEGDGGSDGKGIGAVQRFPDLDRGVEWCEDRVLAVARTAEPHADQEAQGQLVSHLSGPVPLARLMPYLERINLRAGERLIQQGDASDALYLVASGYVDTVLELPGGEQVRLRSAGMGTLVGEMGLYSGKARSASVVAAEPAVIYRLTRAALRTMQERDPELAVGLHESVAAVLAERVAQTTAGMAALLE